MNKAMPVIDNLNKALILIKQLNKLLKLDPVLTNNLVNYRYPVTKEYADSEFVHSEEGAALVGVLSGLLFDTDKYRISASYNDADVLLGFSLLEVKDDKLITVIEMPKDK